VAADAWADRSITETLFLLRDLDARVRERTLTELWVARRSKEAIPHLEQLITLLDDPDVNVRYRLSVLLLEMLPEIVPALHELQRARGDTGRRAVQALAGVQKWHTLAATDQAWILHMIRDKTEHETPQPIMDMESSTWLAVSTADHDGLIEALGLGESMPVTMHFGRCIVNDSDEAVYLTPELDGWTVVFGYGPESGYSVESLAAFLGGLSRRFGRAHWYSADGYTGETGWALAEYRELLRYYNSGQSPEDSLQYGPPHPAEQGHPLPDPDEDYSHADCNACTVAEQASLAYWDLGPQTRVRGYGRIAVGHGSELPLGGFVC
jgi:hypothetical protein